VLPVIAFADLKARAAADELGSTAPISVIVPDPSGAPQLRFLAVAPDNPTERPELDDGTDRD
jgi:hypothetical protein